LSFTGNDLLQTPAWVYERLGEISLDPCAGPSTTIAAENWNIDRGEDGLVRDWRNRFFFCNPPFSVKEKWIKKALLSNASGILLLPERGSAPWFSPVAYMCDAYWVMGKKINFVGGPSSNNLGSVLFCFGEEAVDRVRASGLPGHLCRCSERVSRESFNQGAIMAHNKRRPS
jgi:hypothetical protein